MLGLDVFAVLVKADYVDMVVGPMFKLASSKVSTVSVPSRRIKYSPHYSFRRIRGQHLIAILNNTDSPGFSCVDICLGSFKRLCLSRNFECKPLGGFLNCGQNHFIDDSVTSHISSRNNRTVRHGNWVLKTAQDNYRWMSTAGIKLRRAKKT